MINIILNIVWLIAGGGIAGLLWYLFGGLMAITIIGLPWARSCFNIGRIILWPFGYDIQDRDLAEENTLSLIGNTIWFVFAGVWLAIAHLTAAAGLCISIIGIPFALQHIKFVRICLFPIGKTVVRKGV